MRHIVYQRLNCFVDQRDGEFLWGAYYNNLTGRRASLTVDGDYSRNGGRRFDLKGSLDVFQTGDYSFNASGMGDGWIVRFNATDVSHASIVEVLLKEYLKGLSASLASLSVTPPACIPLRLIVDVHAQASGGGAENEYEEYAKNGFKVFHITLPPGSL